MPDIQIIVSVVEIVVLVVAFVSGITVVALIEISKDDFQGDCLLYSKIEWTSPTYFQVRPASVTKCTYCIGIQSIALIAAFLYAAYRGIVLVTKRCNVVLMISMSVPVYAIFAFLILVQACLVTVGLLKFCWGLQSETTFENTSCRMFQYVTWQHYDGSRFYDILTKAEGASWTSFVCWCVLLVIGVFKMCKDRGSKKRGTPIPSVA